MKLYQKIIIGLPVSVISIGYPYRLENETVISNSNLYNAINIKLEKHVLWVSGCKKDLRSWLLWPTMCHTVYSCNAIVVACEWRAHV